MVGVIISFIFGAMFGVTLTCLMVVSGEDRDKWM